MGIEGIEGLKPGGRVPLGGVRRFKKKPVEIDAIQLLWENWSEICDFAPVGQGICRGVWVRADGTWSDRPEIDGDDVPSVFPDERLGLIIPTLEGDMLATEGDWVIRGLKGEFYPCKPDIFEASYEEVLIRGT